MVSRTLRWRFIACIALVLCTCSPQKNAKTVAETPRYTWIEWGPDGSLARAIMEGECPRIKVDGQLQTMQAHNPTEVNGFEGITVCNFAIPKGAKSLEIAGQSLPVPPEKPEKILLLGDTGCRIKKEDVQNCNGKGEGEPWAFAQVAETAASMNPDLIVHVGDYLYRETPCPEGNKGCEGSPYGDNWATWQVDFFQPAAPLLGAAPWVFVRGNHEDCDRAWKGFFLFLDPGDVTADTFSNCPENPEPYLVNTGGPNMIVIDSADIPHAYDYPPEEASVAIYTKQINQVNQMATPRTWTATHRPFWGVSTYMDGDTEKMGVVDYTLQAAIEKSKLGRLSENIDLSIAGHIHQFEYMTFDDGRSPQVVVGAGGTKLDPPITPKLIKANPDVFKTLKLNPANLTSIDNFNFMIVEPKQETWKMTLYSKTGEKEAEFHQRQ